MDKKFETIVLTEEDFGEDLYNAVGTVLKILFKAGYICVVKEEIDGIIRIDYNYDEYNNFGNALPVWLDIDEAELLYSLIDDEGEYFD